MLFWCFVDAKRLILPPECMAKFLMFSKIFWKPWRPDLEPGDACPPEAKGRGGRGVSGEGGAMESGAARVRLCRQILGHNGAGTGTAEGGSGRGAGGSDNHTTGYGGGVADSPQPNPKPFCHASCGAEAGYGKGLDLAHTILANLIGESYSAPS